MLRLKEKGCLIIIASHNKEDISILCDIVLKMENGKLCQNEQWIIEFERSLYISELLDTSLWFIDFLYAFL